MEISLASFILYSRVFFFYWNKITVLKACFRFKNQQEFDYIKWLVDLIDWTSGTVRLSDPESLDWTTQIPKWIIEDI